MNKDKPTSNVINNDTSTEEEIIEDISIAEEFSDSGDEIPLFLNDDESPAVESIKPIQTEVDDDDDKLFLDNIDELLSTSNIAKHFKPLEDTEDSKENKIPAKSNFNYQTSQKSSSKISDDVILINDRKVSLSDLKFGKKNTKDENETQSRQFSSLQIQKVPPAVSLRTTHSLDFDLSLGSTDDSSEIDDQRENEIEEILEASKYSEVEKDETDDAVAVKKMERISLDYLKEPLDDITEEESEVESKEMKVVNPPLSLKDNLIEKGSAMRKFLEQNMIKDSEFDVSPSISRCHSLDLSPKSVKELQEHLIEKNSYLDALNLKLSSLVRREIFKITKEPPQSATYSIATSASTEYRTINDDLNIKIIDIENELQERAICINDLKEKLEQTLLDHDQCLSENEKLVREIMDLKMKVVDHGCASQKNSDEEKLTILPSKFKDFQDSLNPEEFKYFEKINRKFVQFHEKLSEEESLKFSDMETKLKEEIENQKNKLKEALENNQRELEIQRQELTDKHAKEVEELREYFERRCVDMEKQYSEEVFSQHSKKMDEDSDESDNETLPDDDQQMARSHSSNAKVETGLNTNYECISNQHEQVIKDLKRRLEKYEGNIVVANDEFSVSIKFHFHGQTKIPKNCD